MTEPDFELEVVELCCGYVSPEAGLVGAEGWRFHHPPQRCATCGVPWRMLRLGPDAQHQCRRCWRAMLKESSP